VQTQVIFQLLLEAVQLDYSDTDFERSYQEIVARQPDKTGAEYFNLSK
jgi:hypothetical protein